MVLGSVLSSLVRYHRCYRFQVRGLRRPWTKLDHVVSFSNIDHKCQRKCDQHCILGTEKIQQCGY